MKKINGCYGPKYITLYCMEKPHLSTSLRDNRLAITLMISHLHFSFANNIKMKSCGMRANKRTIYQKSKKVDVSAFPRYTTIKSVNHNHSVQFYSYIIVLQKKTEKVERKCCSKQNIDSGYKFLSKYSETI